MPSVGRTHVLVGNLVTSREHVIGAHASTPIITPAPLTQLHHYLTLIFSLHQLTLYFKVPMKEQPTTDL